MRVNSFNRAIGSTIMKLMASIVIAFCAIFFLAAFVTDNSEDVISKRVNIAVRAIGHELLLRAGDSTSRVPPVIQKENGIFVLEFENAFVFQPDTLVAIAQRTIAKTGLSSYTVIVQECHKPQIVYGFQINPPGNNIEACRGRVQPNACYFIEIAFADYPKPGVLNSQMALVITGVLFVLAVVVLGRNIGAKKSSTVPLPKVSTTSEMEPIIMVGKFVFDFARQALKLGDQTTPLTDKEFKILLLLNKNIGHLTLREALIQEVWTDEGVITGRSLDMFISKIRKKLSGDPDLRITNVHGKGYRLEIINDVSQ